jgi:hypothetical protein
MNDNVNQNDLAEIVPNPVLADHQARLNVTWGGQNGDLPDPIDYDAADAQVITWAQEAIRGGGIPGINLDAGANLNDFVVDRFPAGAEIDYNRVMLRPKTPFGQ